MTQLEVKVLSPAKVIKQTTAEQVQVPGVEGYLGILPGHTAFVTELGIGELSFLGGDANGERYFVAGGYLEVEKNQVTVLVDVIESRRDINRDRAEKSRHRASERLQKNDAETDAVRAQRALKRANERLAVLADRG